MSKTTGVIFSYYAPQKNVSRPTRRFMPAWFLSLAVHLFIGLAFGIAVVAHKENPFIEYPPATSLIISPLDTQKNLRPIPPPDDSDLSIAEITTESTNTDSLISSPITNDQPNDAHEDPQGAQLNNPQVTSADFGVNSVLFANIGAGPGGGNPFGCRIKGYGPGGPPSTGITKSSYTAVDAALCWFKKHQSPNGMWDSQNYFQNCSDHQRCEPGALHDKSDANIAATALALRCFLGRGYDHRSPSPYQSVIKHGLNWLLHQEKNGLWGNRLYEHALATQAIAEAYGMANDLALKAPAQRGVDHIVHKQNRDSLTKLGLGWDYSEATGRNDSSVTGWCVMALKSASTAGLDIQDSLQGARNWLQKTYELSNPDHERIDPYNGVAQFGYAWKNGVWEGEQRSDRVPLGALCAVFLSNGTNNKIAETLANYAVAKQIPAAYPCNTYYLYYNTLTMFQIGGERWSQWNNTVRDMLIVAQRRDGCFKGSWNWTGTQFHGHHLGRIFSTALCCLSLEVYYIYEKSYPSTSGPIH